MMKIFKKKEKVRKDFTWDDISVTQYQEIIEAQKIAKDDDELALMLVAICYKLSMEEVYDKDYRTVMEMAKGVRFVNRPPVPGAVPSTLTLGGHKYTVTKDFTKLTTAQYIDFQQLAEHPEEHMAEFLSVIIIPKGQTYANGYDIKEVRKDIEEHLSVKEALSISSFFIYWFRRCIKSAVKKFRRMKKQILTQLTPEQRKQFDEVEELLVGLTAYMQ